MDHLIAGVLLAVVISFFFSMPRSWLTARPGRIEWFFPVRRFWRDAFTFNPDTIFIPAGLLLALAVTVALGRKTLDIYLLCSATAYIFGPALMLHGRNRRPSFWSDFYIVLALWLPLEFAMTKGWPKLYFGPNLGHILPWGGAVGLALFLFLSVRNLSGMKCCFPYRREDLVYPLVGLMVAALVLIPLGRLLSFMGNFGYAANLTLGNVAETFAGIFFGVALVEEILFRSLIQNLMMQKFGPSNFVLFCSAVIFGASHLNNFSKLRDGTITGAPPNWKYVLLATVAGFIYGKVFQKTNSVMSSAALHAAVNTIRHLFFG